MRTRLARVRYVPHGAHTRRPVHGRRADGLRKANGDGGIGTAQSSDIIPCQVVHLQLHVSVDKFTLACPDIIHTRSRVDSSGCSGDICSLRCNSL